MIPDPLRMSLIAKLVDLQKVSALSSLGRVFVSIQEPGWLLWELNVCFVMYIRDTEEIYIFCILTYDLNESKRY